MSSEAKNLISRKTATLPISREPLSFHRAVLSTHSVKDAAAKQKEDGEIVVLYNVETHQPSERRHLVTEQLSARDAQTIIFDSETIAGQTKENLQIINQALDIAYRYSLETAIAAFIKSETDKSVDLSLKARQEKYRKQFQS